MSQVGKMRGQWISLAVLAGLVFAWQIASLLITAESVPGEPMVPGRQVLATTTLLSLSDNWGGGFGVRGIAQGGSRTYAGAVLAILSNSWDTSLRLYSGLLLGALVGVALAWRCRGRPGRAGWWRYQARSCGPFRC